MITFKSRLNRALALCNRLGVPLAAGVATLGIAIVLTQAALWGRVSVSLTAQVREIAGEERFAVIQEQLKKPTLGTQDARRVGDALLAEIDAKLQPLSAEQREPVLLRQLRDAFRRAAPSAAPFVLILLLLNVYARAYFLVLPARRVETVWGAVLAALRKVPLLVGAWLGVFVCSVGWAPVSVFILGFLYPQILGLAIPSLLPLAALLPRFILAPAIAVQEDCNVLAALRLSYARTKNLWLLVVSNVLGVGAVIWIAASLVDTGLEMLVQAVLRYSMLGYALYWLAPFLQLVTEAYRSTFMVQLSEELAGRKA